MNLKRIHGINLPNIIEGNIMLKYTMTTKVKVRNKDTAEYDLNSALQNFIHDRNGCITGWHKENNIDTKENLISFSCTIKNNTDYQIELDFLIKSVVDQNQANVTGDSENGFTIDFD